MAFGLCTLFWIFAETNWLFAGKVIRSWESWALTAFLIGVIVEVVAAFSWISDNLMRKQRPWWTQ